MRLAFLILAIVVAPLGRADVPAVLWDPARRLAWAVLFTAGSQVLKAEYDMATPVRWLIAIVPVLVGFGAILSYRKFLRMADELMQKIQLEGLAVGFGVGVVFVLAP